MAYTEIDDPTLFFETTIWSTQDTSIDTLSFQPDIVWLKSRSNADTQVIFDSSRGVNKRLTTSGDTAEQTTSDELTAFNSDGFTLGTGDNVNRSSNTMVAWSWKESATAGVDIVGYTGNETARTISHSLSAVPKMIIVKNRDTTHNWYCYHSSLGAGYEILLNTTAAKDTTSQWNSTAPTSSVFSIGNSAFTNGNSNNIIAYLFADKQGFSKFGSYVGNGNANGTYVYLGFRPALVIYKKSSGSGQGWVMNDNKRDTFNVADAVIYANTNEAESDYDSVDFLSNGFKHRSTGGSHNDSGVTYIYLAFAEAPLVNSKGVPCNAR